MMKAIVSMDLSDILEIDPETTIYTLLSKANKKWADDHQGSRIQFIKVPAYVKIGDTVVNGFVNKILQVKEVRAYQDMLEFVYFSHMVSYYISQQDYQEVLFENQDLCEKVLLQFGNLKRYENRTEII